VACFAFWAVGTHADAALLIGRDHLGQKPLYYANTATRLRVRLGDQGPLLAFDPGLRRAEISQLSINTSGLRLICPAAVDVFRGIAKLPPAHLLVLEAGREPLIRPLLGA